MRVHKIIAKELELLASAGVKYTFETGSRHIKIVVDGKIIGILPGDGGFQQSERNNKGILNVRSQLRRHRLQVERSAK